MWRPVDRLSLNLGVRYEQQRTYFLDSVSNPFLTDFFPGGTTAGRTNVVWNTWAPRLGVTFALAPDTVLKGHYGRYYLNLADSHEDANPASTAWIRYAFRDPNANGLYDSPNELGAKLDDQGATGAELRAEGTAVDPDLAYTRYRLGGIYSRATRHEQAIAQLRQAVRPEPDNTLFHYALGAALARADSTDSAIPEFRKAIDLDHYNTKAHYGLARACLQQGRREQGRRAMAIFREQSRESLDDLERSVAMSPDNPRFHAELAVQYSRRGRHLQAINEHKLAIALAPTNARYHRDLGDTYMKVGRYEDAREQFAIASRLAGRGP